MPTLEIEGFGTFEVEEGTRLVKAISACGVDIGHRCGGQARCTTCRVKFSKGEPEAMTEAEFEKLSQTRQLGNMRLSCQIVLDRPMAVKPLMLASEKGWDDAGPTPKDEVEPAAEWFAPEELEVE